MVEEADFYTLMRRCGGLSACRLMVGKIARQGISRTIILKGRVETEDFGAVFLMLTR